MLTVSCLRVSVSASVRVRASLVVIVSDRLGVLRGGSVSLAVSYGSSISFSSVCFFQSTTAPFKIVSIINTKSCHFIAFSVQRAAGYT